MNETEIKYDAYNFPLVGLTEQEEKDRGTCEFVSARAKKAWGKYVVRRTLPKNKAKLKKLLRKGLNPALREWVWYEISGARKLSQQHPDGYFESLYREAERDNDTPVNKQIELDLPRSFTKHPWIQSTDGQVRLRQILHAFSQHKPSIGYCQGLNFVASMLLLTQSQSAERAFWILTSFVEKILFPRTYEAGLEGCHVEMRTLGSLLKRRRPALWRKLDAAGCDISLFAADWFLTLFSTSLPSETAARVWDALFSEGAKVLHRVGLVLLLRQEEPLAAADHAGEAMMVVKRAAAAVHDHERLMRNAFDGEVVGGIPMRKVSELRKKHEKEVMAMMDKRRQNQANFTPIQPKLKNEFLSAKARENEERARREAAHKSISESSARRETGGEDEEANPPERGGGHRGTTAAAAAAADGSTPDVVGSASLKESQDGQVSSGAAAGVEVVETGETAVAKLRPQERRPVHAPEEIDFARRKVKPPPKSSGLSLSLFGGAKE